MSEYNNSEHKVKRMSIVSLMLIRISLFENEGKFVWFFFEKVHRVHSSKENDKNKEKEDQHSEHFDD